MERIVDKIMFAGSLVVLVALAAGGPTWGASASEAILATHLERAAAAPLYGVLADVAAYLPVGEPGFRLGLLGAVLGAVTIAGVIRAARAVLPKDPVAGLLGALLLFLAPPFRDATAFAQPAILAAAALVWTVALVVEHARTPDARRAAAALAAAAAVIGAAPWLGMPVLVATVLALRTPRRLLTIGVAAIGALTIVLWLGAFGRMPNPDANAHAFVASSGRAAVLVGVGLLGIAFGAATKLAHAAWLALVLVLVAVHAIFIAYDGTALLAVLAIGAAIVPSAVVRVLPRQRHVVAAVASVPLVGAALVTGATFAVDDPGDTPSRLATDLLDEVPPGPGVFVATRSTTYGAIEYAQLVAGARPDLALAPPLPPTQTDVVVKSSLMSERVVAADIFAFGRLDPKRAYPRGRSFQLLLAEPKTLAAIRAPARYASTIGHSEATLLALALARFEAGSGRLDAAAHAAGLARVRFNAADLALLATAQPSRPPLLAFVPELDTPVGPWMLELFGDDLAWVAGLEQPDVDAPPPRRLHALWRRLLSGQINAEDPAIAALGPEALAATAELVKLTVPKK